MNEDVVLLSTAEWDNPFWTNKQYVALELAKRGHRVFYIDSIGLRKPSASSQDIYRIFRRMMAAFRPPRMVRENLYVCSPVVLPAQDYAPVRLLNRYFLSLWISIWLRLFGIRKEILWTYYPLTTEVLNLNAYKTIVYHCVDEIKEQPGMPRDILESAEYKLAVRANVVFVTSQKLFETRKIWNRNTYYMPNVADYSHFSQAMDPEVSIPTDIARIPGPRIGFVGAISGYKLDFHLIREIADKNPNWSVILVGKVGEGDPWTDIGLLEGVRNIYLIGPRLYSELPGILKAFDVTILPNRLNGYTECMFPMKFFEYLASGKPVVSVNLHSLRGFKDVVFMADSCEEFISHIDDALKGKGAPLGNRLSVARQYTYRARTQKMMEVISCLEDSQGGEQGDR